MENRKGDLYIMEKKKNTQLIVIAVLSFAILFMTIGFATYAATLDIEGTATAKANTWSVHYVTNSYQETTGSVAASAHNLTNTDFTFTVTLNKPGDFYEATVNVINDGSFNAVLSALTMSTLTTAQSKYLTYTVYYDGTAYTASNDSLSASLPYTSGSNTKAVKVRVQYVQPENSSDLPSSDAEVTLTASLDYDQAA